MVSSYYKGRSIIKFTEILFINKLLFLEGNFDLHQISLSSSRVQYQSLDGEDNTSRTTTELLGLSEALFEASLALSFGDNGWISDGDDNSSEDDISDVLELTAFEWMRIAILMLDGTRGPYNHNQFPKSRDFFSTSLQAPD